MKIFLLIITPLLSDLVKASANVEYNYDTCSPDVGKRQTVSGAIVTAKTAQTLPLNCTTLFRSAAPDDVFLVQVTHVDIRRSKWTCVDSLTVIEFDNSNDQINMLLNQFCGTEDNLPIKKKFYTRGRVLKIIWLQAAINRTSEITEGSGFSLTLTSISKPPVVCDVSSHLRCSNDDCINVQLLCDGVSHCSDGEDEYRCPQNQEFTSDEEPVLPPPAHPLPTETSSNINTDMYLYMPLIVVVIFTIIMLCLVFIGRKTAASDREVEMRSDSIATNGSQGHTILSTISMFANLTLVTSTTTETTSTRSSAGSTIYTPTATTSTPLIGWDVGSPDLISVAIVGSVFAVVLVVCIILGCREKKEQDPEVGRSQNNPNPGYSDLNGPPTPPPTYSYIERQTSYVSDISQRSSQISVPPDYDEALEMPDSPSGRRRSRRRTRLSRSSTGGSSRRNRPRFPFFRSLSAQETIARYRSRSTPPVELVGGPRPAQLVSEADTLPSLREQQDDDNNTSPSDDNVFESPAATLETRAQVEPSNESAATAAAVSLPPVPSAPAGLHYTSRDSSPENQRLLSDGSELPSDTTLVSGRGRTSEDGDREEGEDHVNVTFY